MLSKNFLLGFLGIPLVCAVVDETSINGIASPGGSIGQHQTVLHFIDDPTIPDLHILKVIGITRSYRLSVPNGYDSDSPKKWPLIVDFHGRAGDSGSQWNNSQYFLNSDGQQYFVAYPNGCEGDPGESGRPERAWEGAPYANKTCNDLDFVSALLTRIQKDYNIDSSRIYASGKSNGGGFVGTLACTSDPGDSFAAFAMAAAALYTDNLVPLFPPIQCTGNRPRRILEAHGTEDTTIPIRGHSDSSTPDIARWADRWAERNGCDLDKDSDLTIETWGNKTTYSCNGNSDIVQQYRVEGLGHCWPSLTNNTDSPRHNGTCLVKTLDFTQAVLDFFAQSNE